MEETRETLYPYFVVRFMRRYSGAFQTFLARFVDDLVQRKAGQPISTDDLSECVAKAHEECQKQRMGDYSLPEPDEELMRHAIEEFNRGEWDPVEDVLNELQGCNP